MLPCLHELLVVLEPGWFLRRFVDNTDMAKDIVMERLSNQGFVEKYKEKELSAKKKIMEFFSSYPNITRR